MTKVLMLSGPNLNLLGERRPEIYGTATLADLVSDVSAFAASRDVELEHRQSNFEGELVEAIHDARGRVDAIIINPGALTHYSWSLRDALETFDGVAIEVHLSNPAGREQFRRLSTVADVVDGTIAGLGALGYRLAIDAVIARLG